MNRPRFETESIKLPNGWTGRVLSKCHPISASAEDGSGGGNLHLPAPQDWRSLLPRLIADPRTLPGYSILKFSGHGSVFRAQLSAGDASFDVVVKHSRKSGVRRRLGNIFHRSAEHLNFERAVALLDAGVNTPLPLALMERHAPDAETLLVTRFVPGLLDLDYVVLRLLPQLKAAKRYELKTAIVDAVVDLLLRMERYNLTHRDLKASNILLEDPEGTDGAAKIWLVDLDGLHKRRLLETSRRWRPIMRLAASLLGYSAVTRSDCCRFLRAYLAGTGRPREDWKRHFVRLDRQARKYLDRAGSRKMHKLDGYSGD